MNGTLNLYSLTLAHGDATANNNPSLRFADWKRSIPGLAVENPKTDPYTIPAGTELTVFDGSRSTAIDGTSAFSVALSPLASNRYRFTWSGGTNPVFRTDRNLNLAAVALTLTANANGTLTVQAGSGSPFSSVVVGDEVFIPGTSTGDVAGAFNASNEGRWTVLGGGSTALTLVRPNNGTFVGASEVVTPSLASQFLAYTQAGIQLEDNVDISAGFNANTRKTFAIDAVTSKWFEVLTTSPLVAESGITPGAAGLQFYTVAKRFVFIEVDQDAVVRLNGDTGSTQRLSPWAPADPLLIAGYQKVGPAWTLKIFNRSASDLNALVITAE